MIKEDRATRWTNLLKIDKHSMSKLSALTPDYKLDHEDQAIIHSDCQDIQNQLPMFEENELRVYLELLLTYYCKTKKINYVSGMHEVLAAFFLLGFSGIKTVYSAFDIFVKKMMPGVFADPSTLDPTFKIFHHLLMYHEPLLCSRLDGKMISASVYGQKWFSTLFASSLNISLLLAFWEFCLQEQNPTLPYFFALVYMGKIKEKVLNKKNLSVSDLDLFEFFIDELEELDDLCQEALSLQHQTPTSFVSLTEKIILCKEPLTEVCLELINSVALTILPSDALVPKTGRFIVDLRSYNVYSVGHYPQAFNLPSSLKLSTEELWHLLSGFSSNYTNKSGRLCHFALCGGHKRRHLAKAASLCLDIARRGIERVSIVFQGYNEEGKHDSEQCQWCELNRDLISTAKYSDKHIRGASILNAMWYAFMNELTSQVTTPISSSISTPQPLLRTGLSDSLKPLISVKSTDFESTGLNVNELVKMMWTTGILESESWFEARKNEPRCALHWAECSFLIALLMGTKESRKTALDRLTYAEKISENALKLIDPNITLLSKCKGKGMNPHDLLNILKEAQLSLMSIAVSAEVFLFRAGSHILQKDYPAGSIHFRNAWKQHILCTDLQKTYNGLENVLPVNLKSQLSSSLSADIKNLLYFQEGIFLLSLSMAPASLIRLAKISGMEANKEKGLNMLYKCINSKTGVRVSAALMFVLFWLLVYIPEFAPGKDERYKEANQLIRYGNHYYPRCIYFSWLESYMCARQGKLDRSLKLIKRALSYFNEQSFEMQSPRLLFEKGWVLFLCQEWEQSLNCLLNISDNSVPSPFTQLLMAVNSCMVGNLDQAEGLFKDLCSQGLEKSSVEKWIGRRALRYLGRKWFQLFPYEIIYVTDFLSDMNGEWLEQVLNFLDLVNLPDLPESNQTKENDEFAVLLLLKGTILRNLGRLKDSVRILEKVIKNQSWVMHEKWIVPHAFYELGMVYLKGRDWRSGMMQISKAKKFKKFDFRRSLNFKLNAALELIRHEENTEARA